MIKLLLALQCFTLYNQPAKAAPRADMVFIVPGWGYDLTQGWERHINTYKTWLRDAGYGDNVYTLYYPYKKGPDEIQRAIEDQMRPILQQNTGTYDVVGHSLGAFAGFYSIVRLSDARSEFSMRGRFLNFVSLAGVPFGMNSPLCANTRICGESHKLIVPYKSRFIQNFHKTYALEISQIKKCSLYSRSDHIVKPWDAGRWPDGQGINVEVRGMRHLAAFTDKKYFKIMMDKCVDD